MKSKIENAQYDINKHTKHKTINCIIDGAYCNVPIDILNTDYAEIKRRVDAGELTIKDAE